MTKLSEAAAAPSPEARARVQSEAGTVSDVTAPTWRKRTTLGDRKNKG